VDDGSTDRTPEVLERLARLEPRLRALRGAGRGVSAARNAALAAATGRYVAFLDDDDGWLPEKLAKQVAYLDAHPAVALVYTRAEARYDDGRRCVVPRTQTPAETLEALLASDVIMHSSVMVRRTTLEAVGGFDETMRAAEDYDLWLRIAARYRIACLSKTLTIYRASGSRSRERLCEDFTNQIATARRLLREARHLPGRVRCRLRQKIALTAYRLTEVHRQAQEYGAATAAFACAVRHDPLVGVAYQRHTGCHGSGILFALKPYAGIVYCLALWLRQALTVRSASASAEAEQS
jgi:glycosyltransferase involved in cell wall biosynthesis